ncbi:MAG: hypothetical protein ACLFWG_09195 [Longimicrobiales bacterium]
MATGLGPRIIGEEQFEKEQKETRKVGSHLGGRVLGSRMTGKDPRETAAEAKAAEVKTRPEGDEAPDPVRASALDRLLTDEHEGYVEKAEGAAPESVGDQDGDGYATLPELETALNENPDLVAHALAAELQRDNPRVGAFRLLKSTEEGKESPDPDLLAKIEQAQE